MVTFSKIIFELMLLMLFEHRLMIILLDLSLNVQYDQHSSFTVLWGVNPLYFDKL